MQETMTSRPRRRWRARLLALGIALLLSLLVLEGGARLLLGADLLAVELELPGPARRPEEPEPGDPAWERIEGALPALVGPLAAREAVAADWILQSPATVPEAPRRADLEARYREFGHAAVTYVFNEDYLRYARDNPHIFARIFPGRVPRTFEVFRMPDRTGSPTYRYPAGVTMPTGLVTNRYGFRGRDLQLDKPERTIRIACLGASTTVCGHHLPWSYPQFLEFWLDRWAAARGVPVRFEVLNAGREGIRSFHVRSILEHEVLPFEPDYVVYYEGANQFDLDEIVNWEGEERYSEPPEAVGAAFVGGTRPGAVSALLHLLRRARARVTVLAGEPEKPAQRIAWPEGLDEDDPDLEALTPRVMDLPQVLEDLEGMRELADAHGARFLLCTYVWLVPEPEEIDAERDRSLFAYLNARFWPVRLDLVARLAAFQNRVFRLWARREEVPLIDVAARMPRLPELFVDPVHNNTLGVRARAWTVFERLLPLIEQDVRAGRLPRKDRESLAEHPVLGATRTLTLGEL